MATIFLRSSSTCADAVRRRFARASFAGSFEGARRAALIYSLVQSCTLIDVSPFDYLKDLLRLATHPQHRIAQLTPRGWRDTFFTATQS